MPRHAGSSRSFSYQAEVDNDAYSFETNLLQKGTVRASLLDAESEDSEGSETWRSPERKEESMYEVKHDLAKIKKDVMTQSQAEHLEKKGRSPEELGTQNAKRMGGASERIKSSKDAPMTPQQICQRWGIGCWNVNNYSVPKVPGRLLVSFFGAQDEPNETALTHAEGSLLAKHASATALPGLTDNLKELCDAGWSVTLLLDVFQPESYTEYMLSAYNLKPMDQSFLYAAIPNDDDAVSLQCENQGRLMYFMRQFPDSIGFDLSLRFREMWKRHQDRFDWFYVASSDIRTSADQFRMYAQTWNLFAGSPYLPGVLRYERFYEPDTGKYLLDFEQVFGPSMRNLLLLNGAWYFVPENCRQDSAFVSQAFLKDNIARLPEQWSEEPKLDISYSNTGFVYSSKRCLCEPPGPRPYGVEKLLPLDKTLLEKHFLVHHMTDKYAKTWCQITPEVGDVVEATRRWIESSAYNEKSDLKSRNLKCSVSHPTGLTSIQFDYTKFSDPEHGGCVAKNLSVMEGSVLDCSEFELWSAQMNA